MGHERHSLFLDIRQVVSRLRGNVQRPLKRAEWLRKHEPEIEREYDPSNQRVIKSILAEP